MKRSAQVRGLPDPSLTVGYFISPVETRIGPQRARFSLVQMFPWFGTLGAQAEATDLLAEARYQAFLEARNELVYKVRMAYYPLHELDRAVELERADLEILREGIEEIDERRERQVELVDRRGEVGEQRLGPLDVTRHVCDEQRAILLEGARVAHLVRDVVGRARERVDPVDVLPLRARHEPRPDREVLVVLAREPHEVSVRGLHEV